MEDYSTNKLAITLQSFGGFLECTKCGKREELGVVTERLKNGWPQCCGKTMEWITDDLYKARKGLTESE